MDASQIRDGLFNFWGGGNIIFLPYQCGGTCVWLSTRLVLVHVGTNNSEMESITAIVKTYRQLFRTLKQTRTEQKICQIFYE